MLLPLVIDLPEGDGLAECSRNLLTLRLICLLEVYGKRKHLAAVRDRNSYVLIYCSLLFVNFLDDRICPLEHSVHTTLVCLEHMCMELRYHILRISFGVIFLIKAKVDRKGHHDELRE